MIPFLIAGAVVLWLLNRAPAVNLVQLPAGSAGISDPTQPLVAPAQPTIPPDLPQPTPPTRLPVVNYRVAQPIVSAPIFFEETGDTQFTLKNPETPPVVFSTLSSFSGGLGGSGVGGVGGRSGGIGGGLHGLRSVL
jgi:hypothetical protein